MLERIQVPDVHVLDPFRAITPSDGATPGGAAALGLALRGPETMKVATGSGIDTQKQAFRG